MSDAFTLAVLSDIHYACAAEQARGNDYETRDIRNPALRLFIKAFRYFIWLRHPLEHNYLLDLFLEQAGSADFVVANGDYSCDTAAVGVSDDAVCQSARECLARLRRRFGSRFQATIGDHELGKVGLAGGRGGMRFASYVRACAELKLEPLWRMELGRYVLVGVASPLIALPLLEPEILPEERAQWAQARAQHLEGIHQTFSRLDPRQRVVLFCHDPTALPFLWREPAVREHLTRIHLTIIGHLHSNLVFWKSRMLAGMPVVGCLGQAVRRMSSALHEARLWQPFNVRLCPSLAGIQLLHDGGFTRIELPGAADRPPAITLCRLRRSDPTS